MFKSNLCIALIFTALCMCVFSCSAENSFFKPKSTVCVANINGTNVPLDILDKPNGYQVTDPKNSSIVYTLNICNNVANPNPSMCKVDGAGYKVDTTDNTCLPLGNILPPTVYVDKNIVSVIHFPTPYDYLSVRYMMVVLQKTAGVRPQLTFMGEYKIKAFTLYTFQGASKLVCVD